MYPGTNRIRLGGDGDLGIGVGPIGINPVGSGQSIGNGSSATPDEEKISAAVWNMKESLERTFQARVDRAFEASGLRGVYVPGDTWRMYDEDGDLVPDSEIPSVVSRNILGKSMPFEVSISQSSFIGTGAPSVSVSPPNPTLWEQSAGAARDLIGVGGAVGTGVADPLGIKDIWPDIEKWAKYAAVMGGLLLALVALGVALPRR